MAPSQEQRERGAILFAGVIGTFVILIADLCTENPTVYKAGNLLSQNLNLGSPNGLGNLLIMPLLLFTGFAVCWIYEPRSKVDAFIRGMSIFAVLSLTPPVDIKHSQPILEKDHERSRTVGAIPGSSVPIFRTASYRRTSYVRRFFLTIQHDLKPNATVVYNEWVSRTRPEVGLMSFFTNAVTINKIEANNRFLQLSKGTPVEIDDSYETPLRGYHYVHVHFMLNNNPGEGWIYSGKKPDIYVNVIPLTKN